MRLPDLRKSPLAWKLLSFIDMGTLIDVPRRALSPCPADAQANAPNSTAESWSFSTLYEVSKILGASLELEQNLTGILRVLNSFMGMRKGTILLYDAFREELSIRVAVGMTPKEIARGTYQKGEGILGKVMQYGVPMVIPDIGAEPQFLDRTQSRGDVRSEAVAFIAVPIKAGGETIGVLSVDRLFAERVSFEEDIRVLSIVASLIGQAVNLHLRVMREREGLLEQTRSLQQELRSRYRLDSIVGQSKRMREIYDAVQQVSHSRATVLLRGESGTGKELIARAIHHNSPRADGPFIKINCAALPQTLLESELFGHEKGAFTGATAVKKGRFELADGGSLFLDEIGDLPPDLQVKLLRVLQERSFERVGGTRTIDVDVRIIAATHQDLESLMAQGKFREDLYYRLNVVPILLPPLRERREDIPLLIEHFLAKYNRENSRKVRITGTGPPADAQPSLAGQRPRTGEQHRAAGDHVQTAARPPRGSPALRGHGSRSDRGKIRPSVQPPHAAGGCPAGASPRQLARGGAPADPARHHPSRGSPGQSCRPARNHASPARLSSPQTPDRQVVPARPALPLSINGRSPLRLPAPSPSACP